MHWPRATCWPSGRRSPGAERVLAVPPLAFEREQGYTAAEWQRCLPGAVGVHGLTLTGPGEADVALQGGGHLHLQWQALPPRRIALLSLPRLAVRFRFEGADGEVRTDFMRYFDLYMQRGGG